MTEYPRYIRKLAFPAIWREIKFHSSILLSQKSLTQRLDLRLRK